jgi:putative tryptophan/tyrosine transport system substrate-binding protein
MRRRAVIASIAASAATWPLAVMAAQDGTVARIGYLSPALARTPADQAFEDALRELGWINGRNISIDYRYSAGRQDPTSALTAEIVQLNPDVIVVWGPAFALAAKRAAARTPIIFFVLTDPVAWGIVSSYAHPGGNITGITTFASNDIVAKYLALAKEAIPSLTRLAVLFSTEQVVNQEHRTALAAAAKSLRIDLDEIEVGSPSDFAHAVETAKVRGAEAVFAWPTGLAFSAAKQIAEVATMNGLPTVHPYVEGARAGGLLGYGPDFPEEARRGAVYVDKILKGAAPGSLPVEQVSKYRLVVNLGTAKALGLTLPLTLLVRADEVIE